MIPISFYQILGVNHDADAKEIQAAFEAKIRAGAGNDLEGAGYRRVKETLINPVTRAYYDASIYPTEKERLAKFREATRLNKAVAFENRAELARAAAENRQRQLAKPDQGLIILDARYGDIGAAMAGDSEAVDTFYDVTDALQVHVSEYSELPGLAREAGDPFHFGMASGQIPCPRPPLHSGSRYGLWIRYLYLGSCHELFVEDGQPFHLPEIQHQVPDSEEYARDCQIRFRTPLTQMPSLSVSYSATLGDIKRRRRMVLYSALLLGAGAGLYWNRNRLQAAKIF